MSLPVFQACNSFLHASSILVASQHFEVRGAVNLQEYVSVLILYASASWVDKIRMLFAFFDLDGSDSLSPEETAIMLSSVFAGFARITGQAVPSSKTVASLAQELTSVRAMRLSDLMSFTQRSELFPLLVKYTSEAKPLPAPFFIFHKLVHHSYTPTVTRESRSFSRKSSNFSRLDYSDSPRLRRSLPPAGKGLVIVKFKQDGELITRRKLAEVHYSFDQMADRSGRLSVSLLLNSQTLSAAARRAADRLLREVEGDGKVTFLEFLRLLYPRATNTQLGILQSWTGTRTLETPSLLHGEFFIVPRQQTRGLPLIR